MHILITGGTGFIGSHLVKKCLDEKNKVILLKSKDSSTWRIKNLLNRIIVFEREKVQDWNKIFLKNKIDAIIHLSGKYVKYHRSLNDIKEMNEVNINFPTKLLEIATQHGTKMFINTGTFFEYKSSKNPLSEKSKIEPFNYYTAAKLAFEEILKFYTLQKRTAAITLKLFSPYGEMDNKKIIRILIESFIKDYPMELTKGYQKLSFTYVKDIVDAYYKSLLFLKNRPPGFYELFNIGDDQATSLRQVISILQKIAGKKGRVKLGARSYAKKEFMHAICNSKKAKKILNWQVMTSLYQGLNLTYNYYLKNVL